MSEAPIGVFDSGIGGLSVYRDLGDAEVIYIADQGFGMYGERSLEEVRRRCEGITEYLTDTGVGTIVVACNSASAAALDHLRRRWPDVAFVGMEPAVKPAASLTANGTIGVLATEATFQGRLFASVVDRFAGDHRVVTTTCTGLAAAIEDGTEEIDSLVDEYVGRTLAGGADVIVLGCTHYSLIADRIAARAVTARVIDPGPAVARQVRKVAQPLGGASSFLTTGEPQRFSHQLRRLGFDAAGVDSVQL